MQEWLNNILEYLNALKQFVKYKKKINYNNVLNCMGHSYMQCNMVNA